jgi:hypothetical protein
MGVEEHQNTLVTKVSFAETTFVEAVNLWISQYISYSL